jgi:uncharacterized membrane protein (DUF485 family)
MSSDIYGRVENDPLFKQLVARRSRLALLLSAIVLVSYYAFMAVVAFAPEVFARPLFEGGALTIGGPIGALLIIVSWLLTGLYVSRANGEFDRMTQEIVERNA